MRKLIITFSVFALIAINCFAQNGNDEEYIDSEIIEFALNESYSIRIRQISEREFNARKKESEHLRHQNSYKVITDSDEARKLLEDRVRGVEKGYWDGLPQYLSIEIDHNDGVTRLWNIIWSGWDSEFHNFRAYFPEIGILILIECTASGDMIIDLNNSETNLSQIGNPAFQMISPNKQWRLSRFFPGGAWDGYFYFFEKWNSQTEKWIPLSNPNDFIELPGNLLFVTDWAWISNSKLIYRSNPDWYWDSRFYEMEIIANEKNK